MGKVNFTADGQRGTTEAKPKKRKSVSREAFNDIRQLSLHLKQEMMEEAVQSERTYKKPKPEKSKTGSQDKKDGAHETPAPTLRVSLFAQLSYELEHDPKCAEEFSKLAGKEFATKAVILAKALNSDRHLLSRIAEVSPDSTPKLPLLPIYPTLEEYLDQSPNVLPKLPPILIPELEEKVFIHRGAYDKQGRLQYNYERLEYLGDSYLELMARRLAYQYFPDWDEGKLSGFCQDLVCNANLATYSLAYCLDDRLQLNQKHFWSVTSGGNNARSGMTKIMGDVFEAYIAAVIESDPSNGFKVVETWLTTLWKPLILKYENKLPVNPEAKVELSKKLLGVGIKVEYTEERKPTQLNNGKVPNYYFGAYLTGWGWKRQKLGSGEGPSKQEAGQWAAMEALQNPLTAVVAAVKREYDALVKAEREKEGGPDPDQLAFLDKVYKEMKM